MIPRILLDTATIAGGGELRLMRRGADFSITLWGNELMNSRLSGSEVALATLACHRIAARGVSQAHGPIRMLIGGLGMGFTLRAALAALGDTAEVTVAELVPAVIGWARGPMADLFGGCLDDPRVRLVEGDVALPIAAAAHGPDDAAFDAILLDVDNGPDGLSRAANDRLYDPAGLSILARALRPGGVAAIWSCGPDAAFTRRLRGVGLAVDEVAVRANGTKGARHTIWLATRIG